MCERMLYIEELHSGRPDSDFWPGLGTGKRAKASISAETVETEIDPFAELDDSMISLDVTSQLLLQPLTFPESLPENWLDELTQAELPPSIEPLTLVVHPGLLGPAVQHHEVASSTLVPLSPSELWFEPLTPVLRPSL